MENDKLMKIEQVHNLTSQGTVDCVKALKKMDWDIPGAVRYLCQAVDNPIIIGQVREIYRSDEYPSIKDVINKPIKEKDKILEYMRGCKIEAVAPAIVTDLLNPEYRLSELFFMTDGTYAWRSDVIYYLEKYDMELPEAFIHHALMHL